MLGLVIPMVFFPLSMLIYGLAILFSWLVIPFTQFSISHLAMVSYLSHWNVYSVSPNVLRKRKVPFVVTKAMSTWLFPALLLNLWSLFMRLDFPYIFFFKFLSHWSFCSIVFTSFLKDICAYNNSFFVSFLELNSVEHKRCWKNNTTRFVIIDRTVTWNVLEE